jgi:ABC-2 type transport system permease protein
MKQLMSFIRKEFHHILRDKPTIMILLMMPIIQILLFGFALSTEVKNTNVVVLSPQTDIETQRIINRVNASEYFDVVGMVHNSSEIDNAFRDGKAQLAMVSENNFSENLKHDGIAHVQLIADASDANAAKTFTFYATNIISNSQHDLTTQQTSGGIIQPEVKMLYNPQMKSAFNFVPGVLGMIMMLICAMMTSVSIVREKEMGTMEILLVSPMHPIYTILSKITPYFLLSLVNFTTIMLLSVFVLKVPIMGSFLSLIAVSVLFIFVALSMGLFISTITSSQLVALLIAGMGMMLPATLLSGMIYPVENMPFLLRLLSDIVPARWYIDAVKDIMIKGLSIGDVMNEVGVLAFMAVFFVTISLKKFKVRLE